MTPTLKPVSQARLAARDLLDGLKAHRIWMTLAKMDIKRRYRRSVLGPFWITIAMVVFIMAIGPLYGHLLGVGSDEFIPYLAVGIITWGLISSVITDGASAFVEVENLVHSIKLPYSVHVLRLLQRNLIIFLHNLLAFVPFMLYFGITPKWTWLAAIPGVALILIAALPAALLLGILSARFRDLQPMVGSTVQMLFFVTPVFWKAELLQERAYLANYNPFQLLLEGVRRPIVEGIPPTETYLRIGLLILVLYLVALPFFGRYRRRLAFWV